MSVWWKLTFMSLALCTMASLAAASVMMAEGRGVAAVSLFLLGACLMGGGFALRGRALGNR
ncbi:hypothetical protein GCM10010885_13550 [Alicyclobacillus cellulosilyticus]|uniref:Uncharacterized protein n=1 Tax=Alicyclobacillus cellulosilyticus TaxID=1003997 RepID=A0A917K9G0_9BACL|nr:hypothetical protein [Alicyclobacillus cellulosilyticus]GGJ05699.1 hypothetical protein GCM10010885_13550 [Alicyclobacillus cellulosilyticus]